MHGKPSRAVNTSRKVVNNVSKRQRTKKNAVKKAWKAVKMKRHASLVFDLIAFQKKNINQSIKEKYALKSSNQSKQIN